MRNNGKTKRENHPAASGFWDKKAANPKISISLPVDDFRSIREMAAGRKVSFSTVARELISLGLKEKEFGSEK